MIWYLKGVILGTATVGSYHPNPMTFQTVSTAQYNVDIHVEFLRINIADFFQCNMQGFSWYPWIILPAIVQ